MSCSGPGGVLRRHRKEIAQRRQDRKRKHPQSRRDAAADSRFFGKAASLNFPGGMAELVASSTDLILAAAHENQKFFRGNISSNHDRLLGNDDLLDEVSGSGIFRNPAGDSK